MLRWLYIQLIWLHPAPFRWHFGDDMLDDFDRALLRDKPRYFADALASLGRQWLLRPEFRQPGTPAAPDALRASLAVPLFQTIETYKPRPAALLHGGLLALLSILGAVDMIGKSDIAMQFLSGVNLSRPGLFAIDGNSASDSGLKPAVKSGPDPFEAWLKLARPYFLSMPVLRALDTDGDFTLSPWEIANAPATLRSLDVNHSGKVTAEECGLRIDPKAGPNAMPSQHRRRFMNYHPVLAALDADHDGEISAWEIDHAAASLRRLDHNLDGSLTSDELLPFDMVARAGLR